MGAVQISSREERCFWDIFQLASLKQQDSHKIWESFYAVLLARKAFDLDVVLRTGSKEDRWHLHFKCVPSSCLFTLSWPQN